MSACPPLQVLGAIKPGSGTCVSRRTLKRALSSLLGEGEGGEGKGEGKLGGELNAKLRRQSRRVMEMLEGKAASGARAMSQEEVAAAAAAAAAEGKKVKGAKRAAGEDVSSTPCIIFVGQLSYKVSASQSFSPSYFSLPL